jgi:hypothetical protein
MNTSVAKSFAESVSVTEFTQNLSDPSPEAVMVYGFVTATP